MEHFINLLPGANQQKRELQQEMKEFERIRTAVISEKCQMNNNNNNNNNNNSNQAITCPVPRKNTSFNREYNEITVVTDFPDIILSKASPPYFAGSPPIRASNPLIHDSIFREKRVQIAKG